jgi:hypothetical protein
VPASSDRDWSTSRLLKMRLEVLAAIGFHRVVVVVKTQTQGHTLHALAAKTLSPARPMVVFCTNSWGGTTPLYECTSANFESAHLIDVKVTRVYQYKNGAKVEIPLPQETIDSKFLRRLQLTYALCQLQLDGKSIYMDVAGVWPHTLLRQGRAHRKRES